MSTKATPAKPQLPNLRITLHQCILNNEFSDTMLASMAHTLLTYTLGTHPELNKEELFSWCKPGAEYNDEWAAFEFNAVSIRDYYVRNFIPDIERVVADIVSKIGYLVDNLDQHGRKIVAGTLRIGITYNTNKLDVALYWTDVNEEQLNDG